MTLLALLFLFVFIRRRSAEEPGLEPGTCLSPAEALLFVEPADVHEPAKTKIEIAAIPMDTADDAVDKTTRDPDRRVPQPVPRLGLTGMSFVVPDATRLSGCRSGEGISSLTIPCSDAAWSLQIEFPKAQDAKLPEERLVLRRAEQAEPVVVCTAAPEPATESCAPCVRLAFHANGALLASGSLHHGEEFSLKLADGCCWHVASPAHETAPQLVTVERQGRLIAQALSQHSCSTDRGAVQVDVEPAAPSQEPGLLLCCILAALAFGGKADV